MKVEAGPLATNAVERGRLRGSTTINAGAPMAIGSNVGRVMTGPLPTNRTAPVPKELKINKEIRVQPCPSVAPSPFGPGYCCRRDRPRFGARDVPARCGWECRQGVPVIPSALVFSRPLRTGTVRAPFAQGRHHAGPPSLLEHALLNSHRCYAEEMLTTRLCALEIRSSFGACNFIVVVACRRAGPRSDQSDGLRRLASKRLAELELGHREPEQHRPRP